MWFNQNNMYKEAGMVSWYGIMVHIIGFSAERILSKNSTVPCIQNLTWNIVYLENSMVPGTYIGFSVPSTLPPGGLAPKQGRPSILFRQLTVTRRIIQLRPSRQGGGAPDAVPSLYAWTKTI